MRSKVHENCRLWASCPLPPPLRATPVFVFGLAGRSFRFLFLLVLSWLSARQAPRVFAPLRLWRIGESGPRATEREEARHSAFLMRTNVPTNAECTCAGNGIARELCGAAVTWKKEKRARKEKKEKDSLQGALKHECSNPYIIRRGGLINQRDAAT